mgnify:CR=1 FL=1
MTKDYLKKNSHVQPAQNAEDTKVRISWCTEGSDNNSFYGLIAKTDCVCINPINWKIDENYASAEENLGCEMPDPIKGTTVTMKGFADARIDLKRGTVIVGTEKCKEYMDWKLWGEEVKCTFGPESYHASDFSFFIIIFVKMPNCE